MTRNALVILLASLAGAALAYGAALDGEFHFDDWRTIQSNSRLRSIERTVQSFGPADYLGPARPTTEITFAIDYATAGNAPTQFHATSLALHLAAAVLVFLFARGVFARAGHPRTHLLGAIVAGAFALHPIQTEAVAYAAQRSEVLAALLGLGFILILLAADAAWPRPRAFALSLLAALVLVLALGAKTVAVAYPFAFLLHRLVVGEPPRSEATLRARSVRALALAAPSFVLAVASVARNLRVLGPGTSAGLHAGDLGPWRYLLTQLRVHWVYVRFLGVPAGLTVDHGDYPASGAVPALATVAAGLALLGAAAFALHLWRAGSRDPSRTAARPAAFGILLWLLLLAPTSSFIPILDLVAEHRTYLPSVGLLLAAAIGIDAGLARLPERRAAVAGLALTFAILGALEVALALRVRVWRSDVALWAEAVANNPGSFRAAANHAYALHRANARDYALREYRRAWSLASGGGDVAEVARNLSSLYIDTGDLVAGLAVAADGIAAAPMDAELRNNHAVALLRLGRHAEALHEAERGISLNPNLAGLHGTVALSLYALGDLERALDEFRVCNRIEPDESHCRTGELLTLADLGRREEACAIYRTLVARPGSAAVPVGSLLQAARLKCE